MINNDQSTLLLYCCENVKSHRSGGDTVPLTLDLVYFLYTPLPFLSFPYRFHQRWQNTETQSLPEKTTTTTKYSKNLFLTVTFPHT